jgi:low temperature requirement protein LtrA
MNQPPVERKPVGAAARTWFLGPPRPHGEQLQDRSVGFLELFYDLVFVVFISQLAATLAEHVSVRTTFDYGVLFASFSPTGSLVERFGLFVIIVLGEVVVGVVDGLSAAERDARTTVVGMLALGFWSTYFDVIGERLPRNHARSLAGWLIGHLPLTLAIAAAGAGMVGLIEHAADARTPAGFAWLLSGSVATTLIACAALTAPRRTAIAWDTCMDRSSPGCSPPPRARW